MSNQNAETHTPGRIPAIQASELRRVFRDGKRELTVLQGASISLHRGEMVSIRGPSGSGKSTLLHMLGLLDRPDDGEILLEGVSAGSLSEVQRSQHRARCIGFVFQHCFLLPDFNVLENLLMPARVIDGMRWYFGARKRAHAKALGLLEQVGLKDQATQRPITLSGGERQRVALARALMGDPHVLLCDEPTGNLDPDTGARIMRLVRDLSSHQAAAVLVVTHDQKLAAMADRRLMLDRGILREGD